MHLMIELAQGCNHMTCRNESYGENKLYKSPTNLATPARIPGGAYHGAADMMICIFSCMDTVGGVRLPSRYCGVLGFKSSHGTISNKGIMPVSYSLDS
ncbi:hypothetical protein F2Q68_00031495 [Brassica cretica]|uniref:Amidase domain-containing protein n=2 Tax=Brassica cretica TaxID=69181 RepID=A0A8S9G2M0_BRACR|nr:hypothetical protein F2Q68_00031495 [Brassica cretica]KAF3531059.1 hypothetical protein DY000_02039370 [Brassica cretica]